VAFTPKEIATKAFNLAEDKWWDCREEVRALEDEQIELALVRSLIWQKSKRHLMAQASVDNVHMYICVIQQSHMSLLRYVAVRATFVISHSPKNLS